MPLGLFSRMSAEQLRTIASNPASFLLENPCTTWQVVRQHWGEVSLLILMVAFASLTTYAAVLVFL